MQAFSEEKGREEKKKNDVTKSVSQLVVCGPTVAVSETTDNMKSF